MREIKFRAFDIENNEWYYFSMNHGYKQFTRASEKLSSLLDWEQYTGVEDNNGKEIYEGDIIKYADNESMSNWCRGEVALIVFENGAFLGRMKPFNRNEGDNQNRLYENDSDSREVIGNIHEATEEQLKEWKIEK
jgi:uncharacterized phage protein (TIGR01671 family)